MQSQIGIFLIFTLWFMKHLLRVRYTTTQQTRTWHLKESIGYSIIFLLFKDEVWWELRVQSSDLYLQVLPQLQWQVRAEGKQKNGNGNTGTAGYSSKVAMRVVQVVSKRTVSTGKWRNKVPTWLNMQDGCIFNWCGWKWTRTRISVASYSKNKFKTVTCSWAFGQQ